MLLTSYLYSSFARNDPLSPNVRCGPGVNWDISLVKNEKEK